MMKNILIVLLISTLSTAAFAHFSGKRHHEARSVDKTLERWSEKLDLREDQVVQIRSIMESRQTELRATRDRAKEIRSEMHTSVASVLDSEQLAKFQVMKEKRKNKMKKRSLPQE